MEQIQNNIAAILQANQIIPVVTIANKEELEKIYSQLKANNIYCVEITLRTDFSWEAIAIFKEKYGHEISVGVGTVISTEDVYKCKDLKVDFIVSPGLTTAMVQSLETCGIPFLPGTSTPSEIMRGMNIGWKYFKFFPAELFGGAKALKTYHSVFQGVKFCPTGGINEKNYPEYKDLPNVISVGGSWVLG